MKYVVLGIFAVALVFYTEDVRAQERGIGVSPANIEIGQTTEWPYTVPLLVTNLSSETESFEVTFEKEEGMSVSVVPGRFSLGVGEVGRVLVVFEKPKRESRGFVKVAAIRTSPASPSLGGPEGFTTGTGVKIPFLISGESNTKFLSAAAVAFGSQHGSGRVFGMLAIFAAIISLWYVAAYTRRFAKL